MSDPKIVAIALVTREELRSLGPTFDRAYPVDETPCFTELLVAIDEADREIWRARDKEIASPHD
jgi:hypothetical protein